MCLVLLALDAETDSVLLAANRDEFRHRPAAPAHRWAEDDAVTGGRDSSAGGAWLAVHDDGRWAAVTNIRAPQWMGASAVGSRGELVYDYLLGSESPAQAAARIHAQRERWSGFNLLLGKGATACFVSREQAPRTLAPGIHGLSNATLNTPWPKVRRGRELLSTEPDAEDLLRFLTDSTRAPDAQLPDTGVGLELERALSPAFIDLPDYGTRCSTLARLQRGTWSFTEWTWGPEPSVVRAS